MLGDCCKTSLDAVIIGLTDFVELKVRVIRSLILPVEDVAQEPPEEDHGQEEPDEQWRVEADIEAWIARAAALGIEAERQPGNRNEQQGIILEGCDDIAMQEGMDGTLAAAAGAFVACERQEPAARKQAGLYGVECIVNEAEHQQGGDDQQNDE